jgi:hypothetical protein
VADNETQTSNLFKQSDLVTFSILKRKKWKIVILSYSRDLRYDKVRNLWKYWNTQRARH